MDLKCFLFPGFVITFPEKPLMIMGALSEADRGKGWGDGGMGGGENENLRYHPALKETA